MLFEGEELGKIKLPEEDKHALVLTDGNDNYIILKAKKSDPVTDSEYWGMLARGKDGHSPSLSINSDDKWVIDGVATDHSSRGRTGSISETIELTGNVDLNSVTGNNFYELTNATVSNAPDNINDQFTLLVYGKSAITQILHGVGKNEAWIRGRSVGNTWSSWRQITQWN